MTHATDLNNLTIIPYYSLILTVNVQDGSVVLEPTPSGFARHC
jgi:hypothetical protein